MDIDIEKYDHDNSSRKLVLRAACSQLGNEGRHGADGDDE